MFVLWRQTSLQHKSELEANGVFVDIETSSSQIVWKEDVGSLPRLSGHVRINNIINSNEGFGRSIGSWAVDLDFSTLGGMIYPKGASVQIFNQDSPITFYLKLDGDGRKEVSFSTNWTRFKSHIVFSDDKWDKKFRSVLSEYGISDRVVERFSFDSILGLADWLSGGIGEGKTFHDTQLKVNKILSGGKVKE